MATTIPAKQLQTRGTLAELEEMLLDGETGWSTDKHALYYNEGGTLIPVCSNSPNNDFIYLDAISGSDENDGLSYDAPVKTLSGAVNAFKAAQETHPYFTVVRVYVVRMDPSAYLVLPTDDAFSPITDYSAGLWLYGHIINATNEIDSAAFAINYPVYVIGDEVQLNIPQGAAGSSETDISVKCENFRATQAFDIIGSLAVCADGEVGLAGWARIDGDVDVSCARFYPESGSHYYYGDFSVRAKEYIDLSRCGTVFIAGKGTFITSGYYSGPSTLHVTKLHVKCESDSHDVISLGVCPFNDSAHALYDVAESVYSFDVGHAPFHFRDTNIKNRYAIVRIISKGEVFLSEGDVFVAQALDLKCEGLHIGSPIHVGYFSIDVSQVLEMVTPPSNIYMEIESGDASTSDYISYDRNSNNSLKCGYLLCTIPYSSGTGEFGLIHTAYRNAIKNIDIQIGAIVCPSSAYGLTAGGTISPQVLGSCTSGSLSFNSTISGHVGGYVSLGGPERFKVSAWAHDIRQIPPSYGGTVLDPLPGSSNNPGGIITLKFDDIYETNHFWYDPDQGDDALDGCTRQTPVKTVTGLIHAIMKKCQGSVSSNVFTILAPVTIHILSVGYGSNREVKWFYQPADAYDLPEWMENSAGGSPRGILFDCISGYSGCRVQFNMLEFVPEAPDMSLYVRAFNANVLIAKGFYNIGLCGYGSSGISYLEASGSVGIWNNTQYGGYSYYSNRLGPLSIKARDIVLYGWFNNLTAIAENDLYICDTYGGYPQTESNCCLAGTTNLQGSYVYLGYAYSYGNGQYVQNKIGIAGRAYIKATVSIFTRVDTMMGVVFLEAAEDITGGFADAYFRGVLYAKCTNCYLTSGHDQYGSYDFAYYSFSTYDAAGSGGAGIINIQASKQIIVQGWGTSGSDANCLYGVDLYLKALFVAGSSSLYVYGNNGNGKIVVDADEMYLALKLYYYAYIFIKAQHCSAPQELYSGGPWSDAGGTTQINLDIGKLRSSIQLPTYVSTTGSSSIRTYEITGRIGLMNAPVLSWGQPIDPDDPPTIYNAVYDFSIVVGHVTTSGHGIDKTGWVPDNSGSIIVLNDQKQLVAGQGIVIEDTGDSVVISGDPKPRIIENPVTIANGVATVQLALDKYNIITGIDGTVTDLVIEIPGGGTPGVLVECGFEFYLDAFASPLTSVSFASSSAQLSSIVPSAFTPEHLYQGVVVNNCITLAEYDRPDLFVVEISGRKYRTVKIGEQTWMAENLADPNSGVWYDNDQATYEPLGYGKLYTWAEAMAVNVPGWHVPSPTEFVTLANTAGGINIAGSKLKSRSGWDDDGNGTDDYGFNAKPSGTSFPGDPPTFNFGGKQCWMWTNNEKNATNSFMMVLMHDEPRMMDPTLASAVKDGRCCIRLVKDMSVNIGGRDYKVVQIGNQLWMAENLDWKFNGLTFRDGTSGNEATPDPIAQGAYYNYDETTYGESGNKYGILYNWNTADYLNNHLAELGVPDGWHVPTRDEWEVLVSSCGENPGTKLKSTSDWTSGAGTDFYGFNAKPAGHWYYGFGAIGSAGNFWTSERDGAGNAWRRQVNDGPYVDDNKDEQYRYYSIRLVKNIE